MTLPSRSVGLKKHTLTGLLSRRAPEILAVVLAAFWAVTPAAGAGAQMTRTSPYLIEIKGEGWRLAYGTQPPDWGYETRLANAEGNRAWFSHGGWLRLIDTQKGLVIGRWRFPGQVTNLTPRGELVQIEVEDRLGAARSVRQTLTFDPKAPSVPEWPANWLSSYRVPITEIRWTSMGGLPGAAVGTFAKVSPEQAKQLIPELEEAVRRDPHSPWFRFTLARLLRDTGDPRATAVFQEAIRAPPAHFTELLRISAALEELGEPQLASEAFERGYRDFISRGYDPRLLVVLIDRLMLYSVNAEKLSAAQRRELPERMYRLSPRAEGAAIAWRVHADELQKNGRTEEARLWRARAEEPETLFFGPSVTVPLDRAFLLAVASVLAAVLYILFLHARYRPQARLDLAARERATAPSQAFSFQYLKNWSRGERIAFFILVFGVGFTAYWMMPIPPASSRSGFLSATGAIQTAFAVYFAFPVAVLYFLVLYLRRQRRLSAEERQQDSSLLNVARWGWGQSIAFLAIVFGGWLFGYLMGSSESQPFPRAFLAVYPAIAAAILYFFILYLLDWPRRRQERAAGVPAPGFTWFSTVYWDRRDRIGFLTIVLVGWFAAGVAGGYVQGILRMAASPVSLGGGSLAGPVTTRFLQDHLPQTPARDFLLALAYQQSGDKATAERLYRGLPDFAESWNNLGVLLKEAGKEQEARQAFEEALRRDPGLAEAALNLGRPPQTIWTEQHQKYLPGRPMIAPPQGDIGFRAFFGGAPRQIYLRALAGPFGGSLEPLLGPGSGADAPKAVRILLIAALALALAVVFLIPARDVTQPPGRMQPLWETLFPGVSPAWRFFQGVALAVWTLFVLQAALMLSKGSPQIVTAIALPNLQRAYGLAKADLGAVLSLINPSWIWLYLAPAVLFGVNLFLLWRARRPVA